MAYRSGDYTEALQHYERARSIVELVKGLSRADQVEVDANRVAVECNIAAALLANKDYGAAATACTRALALDPTCKKALVRRAKARLGRHEFRDAAEDIKNLRALDPFAPELEELEALAKRTAAADKAAERAAFGDMFSRAQAA